MLKTRVKVRRIVTVPRSVLRRSTAVRLRAYTLVMKSLNTFLCGYVVAAKLAISDKAELKQNWLADLPVSYNYSSFASPLFGMMCWGDPLFKALWIMRKVCGRSQFGRGERQS